MAKDLSYLDRRHIKQTIKDSYDPAMRDCFPSSTPEVSCHSADPTCPLGVDFLRLSIQITLLHARDTYAVMMFRQIYEQGIKLSEVARRQRTHREYVTARIERMLDNCIDRMPQRTAEMIKSVYWEMHRYDIRIPAGKGSK